MSTFKWKWPKYFFTLALKVKTNSYDSLIFFQCFLATNRFEVGGGLLLIGTIAKLAFTLEFNHSTPAQVLVRNRQAWEKTSMDLSKLFDRLVE